MASQAQLDADTQPSGLTAALAWLAAHPPQPSAAVNDAVRRALVDTVGVMLAGRIEPAVGKLAGALAPGAEVSSLATGDWFATPDAALLDGLAAHVLDYDDVAQHGHPSVVILPALLAEARRRHLGGGALIRAAAVGYATWHELARREHGTYHLGAWHPTPMLGVVSAAAALAALAGLDEARAGATLSLAASMAAGLIASFGTEAKPLQAGRAAASAITALRWAEAGLDGGAAALESPHGLLAAISPAGDVDRDGPLDQATLRGAAVVGMLSVKRYPVCHASHRTIDALLALRAEHRFAPGKVAAITAAIGPSPIATLRHVHPSDGLEARFSLHHNLAAALLDGAVGFAQLDDDRVRADDMQAAYGLTRIVPLTGDCPDQPGMAREDRVVVTLRDGNALDSGPVRYPRGHARMPLSDAELDARFLDCAARGGYPAAEALLARLHGIADCADVAELAA